MKIELTLKISNDELHTQSQLRDAIEAFKSNTAFKALGVTFCGTRLSRVEDPLSGCGTTTLRAVGAYAINTKENNHNED